MTDIEQAILFVKTGAWGQSVEAMNAQATILDSLNDAAQRQGGCAFCNDGAPLTSGFLSDSNIAKLNSLSGETSCALRVGVEFRQIKFCPMCGKKLEV